MIDKRSNFGFAEFEPRLSRPPAHFHDGFYGRSCPDFLESEMENKLRRLNPQVFD
jgi:hypothetical protein